MQRGAAITFLAVVYRALTTGWRKWPAATDVADREQRVSAKPK